MLPRSASRFQSVSPSDNGSGSSPSRMPISSCRVPRGMSFLLCRLARGVGRRRPLVQRFLEHPVEIGRDADAAALESIIELEPVLIGIVPGQVCIGGVEDTILLMEELPTGGRLARSWAHLAETLDRLHASSQMAYGWDRDYGFGELLIENGPASNWVDFWADRRLRCHIPYLSSHLAQRIERLADRLGDHISQNPTPSLLHGDLWGGNILIYQDEISGLIDPACYHGDREVDLAMLSLFDQPPPIFYEACGLDQGWEARQPVYRLWPLLVHLRLFGGSYHQQTGACLEQIGY